MYSAKIELVFSASSKQMGGWVLHVWLVKCVCVCEWWIFMCLDSLWWISGSHTHTHICKYTATEMSALTPRGEYLNYINIMNRFVRMPAQMRWHVWAGVCVFVCVRECVWCLCFEGWCAMFKNIEKNHWCREGDTGGGREVWQECEE